jgi:hypothetical protein
MKNTLKRGWEFSLPWRTCRRAHSGDRGVEQFRRGYRINALFNDVHEPKVGDRVKMAGVEIDAFREFRYQ